MARPFTVSDARRITLEHQQLKQRLNSAQALRKEHIKHIEGAAAQVTARGTLAILKDISIEEINRNKEKIRIKTLSEAGYRNVADVYTASVYELRSIYGISEQAALLIKRNAAQIAHEASKGVKIKLSLDNKTPEAAAVVRAIFIYRNTLPLINRCAEILKDTENDINRALEDLVPGTKRLGWAFSSKRTRQISENAFIYLQNELEGIYGLESRGVLNRMDDLKNPSDAEAWNDFAKNPVQYFNILEQICPGRIGSENEEANLPEDLARKIRDQDFFPEGLLCELRRYQEWGVKYILHQERVLLGDEMGLGKTVQAIAAMVSLRNTGATHFVVVCPASVLENWCREIRKMSLLSATKVHGSSRSSALRSWIRTGGVAVTTYETTAYFKLDEGFRFSMLTADEAHYIKNPDAKRTINVRRLCLHADRLLFMTGTALENKAEEMVSLIRILQPGIASQVKNMTYLSSAPQFREKVAPVYYRRKREDVLTELPELIQIKEWCTLLPEEEEIYERTVLEKNFMQTRRVSWNAPDLKSSSKASRMLEILQEAQEAERKIIVFSFFLDTIERISQLPGLKCYGPINGSVPPAKRQEIIDGFEKAPAGSVLLAQIQSGGTGLNIQSASVVIICEPQFKPSTESQAISRAYRMGQTRNVLVYRLLCENTVDEKITDLLEEKQQIFDAFADKSAAAQEDIALDNTSFGSIIEEEIERIKRKHGQA